MSFITSPYSSSKAADVASFFPVAGSLVGAGRFTCGTLKIGYNCPKYVLCKIYRKNTATAAEAAVDGLKMTGRGLIEIIPIVGNIAAVNFSMNKLYGYRDEQGERAYYNPTSGGIYRGSLKGGLPCGQGTYTTAAGDYKGEFWVSELRCVGHDVIERTKYIHDGSIFSVSWGRQGAGRMRYANGDVYEGYWDLGQKSGHGKMTYANGNIYDGPWRSDKPHGTNGKMTYPDGSKYVGDWQEGVRSGNGTLTLPSGEQQSGTWCNGSRNGHATNIKPDGTKEVGTCINGTFIRRRQRT